MPFARVKGTRARARAGTRAGVGARSRSRTGGLGLAERGRGGGAGRCRCRDRWRRDPLYKATEFNNETRPHIRLYAGARWCEVVCGGVFGTLNPLRFCVWGL